MIEVIARGPIEYQAKARIDRQSGHDRVTGRVTETRTREVTVDLEFPKGYVNLEGYAPSYVDWPISEIVGRYVDELDDSDGFRQIRDSEWEIEIRGDAPDWIQQAHRYMTERPHKSLVDCLWQFKSWDETDDDSLDRAIERARRVGNTMVEMGEMDDDQWAALRADLNGLDRVSVPESYADPDPA